MFLSVISPATSAPAVGNSPGYDDDQLFRDLQPAQGDPYAEMMALQREVDADADYDFGGPFERDSERAVRELEDAQRRMPAQGGIVDTVVSTLGAASAKSVGTLQTAVKKMGEAVAKEIKRVDVRINNVQMGVSNQIKATNTIKSQVARLEFAWKNQFGEQSRWKRAALFVANQIPGLRSFNILSSPEIIAVYKYLAALSKDSDDFTLGAPTLGAVPAAGVGYVQADMNAIITALVNNANAQNTQLAAVCQYLADRAEAADELGVEKHLVTLQGYSVKDIFGQIASFTPGQLEDREQAIAEGLGKYALGTPRAAGASILTGLI